MRRLRKVHPTPSMVVACLALLVALAGTSVAAVTALPPNSVGTAQLRNNAVNSLKVKDFSLLDVDLAPGVVPPSTLWAVVFQSGAIARSTHAVTSVSHPLTGVYRVLFDRDVSRCAFSVTIGNPTSSGLWFGLAGITVDPGLPNVVEVVTLDAATAKYADRPFYLALFC